MAQRIVTVHVNGKKLKVSCPEGQESALIKASEDVDSRLKDVANSKQILTTEQSLMITALNLANELQQLKTQVEKDKVDTDEKIQLLQSTIEQALLDANKNSKKRA